MKKIRLTESELTHLIRKVINENSDREALKDVILGRSYFIHDGNMYELTGYRLLYELTNGKKIIAFCNKEDANAVTGARGLSKNTFYVKDVQFLDVLNDNIEKSIRYKESNDYIVNTMANKIKLTRIKFLLTLKPSGAMSPNLYNKLMSNELFTGMGLPVHSTPPYKETEMDFADNID